MVVTNFLTASETISLVSSGKVSLEQVVQDHEDRYQERDDDVKAWVVTNHQNVKVASKDTSKDSGPLRGVMIAVKDMMSTYISSQEVGSDR
jgi:Asp-tRNA(Asn)/Glu-tRNA(Gln) amidotransferase A subunit family amidase